MRQHFCLLLLCAAVQATAQQPYHPMLQADRSWDVFVVPPELSICPYTFAYHAVVRGDTLIGNTTYSLIGMQGIHANPPVPFCGGFYLDTSVTVPAHFVLREDTLARRVYRMELDGTPEQLLYDFSLQAGDSLHYPFISYKIESVFDIPLANGETRKAFQVGDWWNSNMYVEGIGYLLGPFTPVFWPFEGWDQTTCARAGEAILWSSTAFAAPGCVEGLSAVQYPETQPFRLWPNPATEAIWLSGPDDTPRQSFCLYNLLGRKVLEAQTEAFRSENRFDIRKLPGGPYLWTLNGKPGGLLLKH